MPISPAWADGARCAEWLGILSPCMSGLDTYRNTGYTPGSTNDTCTISLNTPSSPIPLPLGLHALPLRSLDRVRPQADPTSPFERRVVQHTHSTYSINGSSATSTNLPPPGLHVLGQLVKQASALMHEAVHASSQTVNSEPCCKIVRTAQTLVYLAECVLKVWFIVV